MPSPVLEGAEASRDALDPPLSVLVGVQEELDGGFHLQLLLQGEEVLLPGTPTLREDHHLSTGVCLQDQRYQGDQPGLKHVTE